jgi:hypothetical protein
MLLRTGVILLVALCESSAMAHQPILIDARHATPGLRLSLQEFPEKRASRDVTYRLQAFGFPKGAKLLLWSKEFDHSFHQLGSVFQVDRSGVVMEAVADDAKRPRKLDGIIFGPGTYPRGALWEVALVSVDRKFQAFAKAIPYPIIASNGDCTVSLELVSHRGEKFMASGAGFLPGDEISTELRYSGRVIENRVRTFADGFLPPQVLLHASVNTDRHAQYSVKSRTCEVSLDYDWGEAALSRRQTTP